MTRTWQVYILLCSDGSLYTGITTDMERRLLEHRAGRGARYCRGRTPLQLVFLETGHDHSSASRREAEIKGLRPEAKRRLIAGGMPAPNPTQPTVKEPPSMSTCPCGSGSDYSACCEPIIAGRTPAATPEQLMRARYSAHVKVEIDFLHASTHPDHREGYDHEGTRTWAQDSEWHGLEILGTGQVAEGDKEEEVEFIARFRDQSGLRRHHERARFRKKSGKWLFTEGIMVKPKPLSVEKIGRNDPCPCGSGAKYKKCCGK